MASPPLSTIRWGGASPSIANWLNTIVTYYRFRFRIADFFTNKYVGNLSEIDDCRRRIESLFPTKKRFPIFNYKLDKNFLSYCKRIYEKCALMETAFLTPGGYYARISDPAANQLEVECYSFEDDDPTIDSSTMPFFFRH